MIPRHARLPGLVVTIGAPKSGPHGATISASRVRPDGSLEVLFSGVDLSDLRAAADQAVEVYYDELLRASPVGQGINEEVRTCDVCGFVGNRDSVDADPDTQNSCFERDECEARKDTPCAKCSGRAREQLPGRIGWFLCTGCGGTGIGSVNPGTVSVTDGGAA